MISIHHPAVGNVYQSEYFSLCSSTEAGPVLSLLAFHLGGELGIF
jgi:hypothetical protein